MGWVLKSWRSETVAIQSARDILRAAERDARRIERRAAREAADAAAYLDALEHVGLEVRRQVQDERRRLRARRAVPAAPLRPAPARRRRRRHAAPLRDTGLSELFRATSAR